MEEKDQVALENLISAVTNPPVLNNPDFRKYFIIHVGASNYGLGYALYQQPQDQLRTIGCASRTLVSAEKLYQVQTGVPSTEMGCL